MVSKTPHSDDNVTGGRQIGAKNKSKTIEDDVTKTAIEPDAPRQTKKEGYGHRAQDVAELKDYVCEPNPGFLILVYDMF